MIDMELRDLVIHTYQEYIRTFKMPGELKRALKTKERIPAFLDRIVIEFKKLDEQKVKYKKKILLNLLNTLLIGLSNLLYFKLNQILKKAYLSLKLFMILQREGLIIMEMVRLKNWGS
jgi:hypothetical protein